MVQLPKNVSKHFSNFLIAKNLSDKDQFFYKKWLRFYWDFCHKYQHNSFSELSLPLFLVKLRQKGQSELQQRQASTAVSLFYEICAARQYQNKVASDNGSYKVNSPMEGEPDLELLGGATGVIWEFVFDQLLNEIKIRHYSPQTLKAYRGWTSKLQAFTKSKNYQLLSQKDVIDFLTYLAVEKEVSASSQNQAFNGFVIFI